MNIDVLATFITFNNILLIKMKLVNFSYSTNILKFLFISNPNFRINQNKKHWVLKIIDF